MKKERLRANEDSQHAEARYAAAQRALAGCRAERDRLGEELERVRGQLDRTRTLDHRECAHCTEMRPLLAGVCEDCIREMEQERDDLVYRARLADSFTFEEYEQRASQTIAGPHLLERAIASISEEAGEIQGAWKRYLRGDFGLDEFNRRALDECGDVLWYLHLLAKQLGSTLGDVAKRNIAKLADRAERGVIQGEGDER